MAKNRKAAETLLLELLSELQPGNVMINEYKERMSKMSDAQFDSFMKDLSTKEERLSLIVPNLSKEQRLSVDRNFAFAKKYGHNFFERIWMPASGDKPAYLTPKRYLVLDEPVRRQAQLLIKKISIPQDNKSIDDFTGQPTGKSKGAKISYPELQILAARKLDKSIEEMMKWRGGDLKGFNAMNQVISKTGVVSLDAIKHMGSQVRSTTTLRIFLTSMHLGTTGLN